MKTLAASKLGKVVSVLVIAGLVSTASATVFTIYYGSTTATAQTSDVTLVAGTDNGAGACPNYPCASVSVGSTNDFATIGISFFKSNTNTPQPSTYYTNLLKIHDATDDHSINSISVSGITDTNSILGSISIYYCTTQTDTPATSANCDVFTFTSTTGGSVSGSVTFPHTITAGSDSYIEAVAFAKNTATTGQSVTFSINVNWV